MMATATELEVRVVKRQKLDVAKSSNQVSRRSHIFAPFRTLGLVSPTAVPFISLPLGKTTFQITTSNGRNLQTYDLKRGLQLVFITSPQTPESITATATFEKKILAAWANEAHGGVWLFQRGKKVGELELPHTKFERITRVFCFGTWIVGCCTNRIEVWNSSTLEHYTTLYSASLSADGFTGHVCALPTYLNKIFAGKKDGSVEIWNVSTGKLIYTILPPSAKDGAVTALHPAPAISLLAIAYSSGKVNIHDIRADKPVVSVNSGNKGRLATSAISFRTDGYGAGEDGQKDGVMATASAGSGDVTFWDLNKGGRKMGVLRGAHSPPSANGQIAGGISNIEFLPGQAVLVSSGMDNALKTWVFDDMPFSPIPRILHSRGGHAAPVSSLQFLPTQSDGSDSVGKWLMSSSHDRSFWGWSLRRDGQSTEISQGNIRKKAKKAGILNSSLDVTERGTTLEELKAPRITSIACSMNRDGGIGAMSGTTAIWTNETKTKNKAEAPSNSTGWESVVTAHENDKFTRTWFWGRKRAGRWKFATSDGTPVSSVSISPCGTFAVVGSTGGLIDTYNLQSGIHRQRFPAKPTAAQAQKIVESQSTDLDMLDGPRKFLRGEGRHLKAVTGIVVDNLNKTLISCGEDGKVKFWDFMKGLLLHELDWSLTSIRAIRYHRPSDLIATTCDDGSIRVVDIETRKLVRELWGCKGSILDFDFSNDGRWIITSSTDSVIRVFDLATGHLIEALRFKSQPIALAFSSTGEYLATAHQDSVGVHLWTNRTLFTHVPTRQIGPNEFVDMEITPGIDDGTQGLIEGAFDDEASVEDEATFSPSAIDQLSENLLTLSLTPKARWQTLLHLNTIRDRNKPKEAPKKPQAAPFFLPSLLSNQAATPQPLTNDSEPAVTTSSRVSKIADPSTSAVTKFTSLLTSPDPSPLFTHLSSLPPSAADLAIRTLDPSSPYTEPIAFIDALTNRLRQKRDYELIQTWMAVFLRCHSSLVVESEEVKNAIKEWKFESDREGKRVGELVGYVRGVVGWVGGVV